MVVGEGLTEFGQREGEAGGEQEHRVHHRQQDHQSGHGQVIRGVWSPLLDTILPVECPLVLRAGEVENTKSKCSLVNWAAGLDTRINRRSSIFWLTDQMRFIKENI